MEEVITADGSVTFRSEKVGECYHTQSGAVEESNEKFVAPSNISNFVKNGKVVIFDVCFGLGYNTAAVIDAIKKIDESCEIVVYAFENDQEILDKIKLVNPNFDNFNYIKDIVDFHELNEDNVRIHLLLGDAKEKIKEVKDNADLIFFDPFSPKKAPEMWVAEFFEDIYSRTNPGGILTTYSCARVVRDNLKSVGFNVCDGPIIGRRSPSTVATK